MGLTVPSPVIATRRRVVKLTETRAPRGRHSHDRTPPDAGGLPSLRRLVLDRLLDVIDGLTHRFDLLGLVVGDLDVEFFFELHDQLDDVERVRPDVFNEGGVPGDGFLVHRQVFADDLDDALLNGHGSTLQAVASPPRAPRPARLRPVAAAPGIVIRLWPGPACGGPGGLPSRFLLIDGDGNDSKNLQTEGRKGKIDRASRTEFPQSTHLSNSERGARNAEWKRL